MSNLPCGLSFLSQLATDLGIDEIRKTIIAVKAEATLNFYNGIAPTTSPADILGQGQSCLSGNINTLTTQLGTVFLSFVVACVVLIIVFSLSIFLVITYCPYPAPFVVSIIFVGLSLLGLAFYLAYQSLNDDLAQTRTKVSNCAQTVTNALQTYTTDQEKAVSSALCFYADL